VFLPASLGLSSRYSLKTSVAVFSLFFIPFFVYAAEGVFEMASWFAVTSAGLLDVTVKFTADVNSYKIPGITIAWEVFRDLANMGFIFILLYVAFMTVLQIGGVDAKRLVASVIIVGLLVNFSFFLTGAVIDVGNIIGGFIYETLTPMVDTPDGPKEALLGETLTGALKTSTIFDEESYVGKNITLNNLSLIFLLGAVFFFISAFVFLAAAILFITRTVVLMLVLILSPIAFVAAVLPKTQGVWQKWISALVGNTAVLPIFLLLIAVVVLIAGDDSLFNEASSNAVRNNPVGVTQDANQALAGAFINKDSSDPTQTTTILSYSAIMVNFMIIIGLMIAALKISQAAAGSAGAAVAKVGGRITRGVVGVGAAAGAGAAALAYRQTAGRIAARRAQDPALQKRAETDRGARLKLKAYQGIAGSSGDIRNVGVVKKALDVAGIKAKTGGGKGGFAKTMEDKIKKDEKFADSLGMTDEERVAYAENLRDEKSPSRLGLWTSRRDKEAAQRIGQLEERKHDRGVETKMSELKKTSDYKGKKDAAFKAKQDVDTKGKAYAQARSDGNDRAAADIQYELENAEKALSDKNEALAEVEVKLTRLKETKKGIKKREKTATDVFKEYLEDNPRDAGKNT